MANDYLYTVAQEILATAVAILEEAEIDVPERRFVTFGEVTDDCDTLVVTFRGLYTGNPGQPNNQPEGLGYVVRSAQYELRKLQCVALPLQGRDPTSPESHNEDAENVLTGLWVLYQGFVARKADKSFLEACQGFTMGEVSPIDIAPGMSSMIGGGLMVFDVQVN